MSWVRRTREMHRCARPMREVAYTIPSASLNPDARVPPYTATVVAGSFGDLWRCDECGKLWRIGRRCDLCEAYGPRHGGQCVVGLLWREASLWQRIRFRGLGGGVAA